MTSTAKTLIVAQDAPDTLAAALYTSPPAGKGTWIDKFTALNHSAAVVAMDVYLVPAGGTPDTTNQIYKGRGLSIDFTDNMPECIGKFLAPGDEIWAAAGVAASINIAANGREIT